MEADRAKGNPSAEQLIKEADSDPADPSPKKFRPNWRRIGITAFIVALIVLAVVIILIFTKTTPTQEQEILNITYSIKLENGTLIDSGTRNFVSGNVASTLGFETDKVDDEIKDMKIEEEKTIELEAKEAYGERDEKLVYAYNRTEKMDRINEINRTDTITIEEFTEVFKEQPVKDKVYEVTGAPFKYKVLEVTDTKVKLSIEVNVGQEISTVGFFPAKVIEVTENKVKLKLMGENSIIPTQNGNLEINFTETQIIFTLSPEMGQEVQLGNNPKGKVTALNATHITV
ncbi:MAG: FKBP-type peptidyl-prolyl cis-trans isomerase, partial [Candidatus Pacearchaeota archaeon]|nr:FKBP-type peptidyl-prolyl cis-trans isomerase [Candidatus Pacearchaeota archaeon]